MGSPDYHQHDARSWVAQARDSGHGNYGVPYIRPNPIYAPSVVDSASHMRYGSPSAARSPSQQVVHIRLRTQSALILTYLHARMDIPSSTISAHQNPPTDTDTPDRRAYSLSAQRIRPHISEALFPVIMATQSVYGSLTVRSTCRITSPTVRRRIIPRRQARTSPTRLPLPRRPYLRRRSRHHLRIGGPS